jgi:hypothetical protein
MTHNLICFWRFLNENSDIIAKTPTTKANEVIVHVVD